MLKVAICDNEEPIREYLKKLTNQCIPSSVRLFAAGEELLASDLDFDVILLDICMEDTKENDRLDGMETAKRIRKNSDAIIIFITAYKEYVYEAYDVEAFHYLLKPIDEEKFAEVIKKAAAKVSDQHAEVPLVIKVNGSYRKIPIRDIFYVENDARKVILHTKRGDFSYYEKMEILEQKLGEDFFRSHRGFLVHLAEVAGYDRSSIELKNGDTVFLAKQKYSDFVTAYMNYLTR